MAGVIQSEQAVEHLAPRGFRDCVADALLGFVETVAEVKVGPSVDRGNRRAS